MTRRRCGRTLVFTSGADRRETTTGDPAMTEHRIVEPESIIEDGAEHRETLRKDYVSGGPRGRPEEQGRHGRRHARRAALVARPSLSSSRPPFRAGEVQADPGNVRLLSSRPFLAAAAAVTPEWAHLREFEGGDRTWTQR